MGRQREERDCLEGYSLPWNTRTYMVVGGTHSGLMEPKWAEKGIWVEEGWHIGDGGLIRYGELIK